MPKCSAANRTVLDGKSQIASDELTVLQVWYNHFRSLETMNDELQSKDTQMECFIEDNNAHYNDLIAWQEVISALHESANNKACGLDEVQSRSVQSSTNGYSWRKSDGTAHFTCAK
ncbi:hypothetical protein LUQ84_001570 [Hamiltosporidium tvaerminnensis]|nr:hypothetical protein LUQ84_001570 [Hamiltosporidium tvaerminnensis]